MRILVLSTSVASRGGVQYATRLILRAMADQFPDAEISVVTLTDHNISSECLGIEANALGCKGSRLRMGISVLRRWSFHVWDLVVFAHINLCTLALLANPFHRSPMLAWIYGTEAWEPIPCFRRRGLQRVARVLYDSEVSRCRSESANPWLAGLPNGICHLALLLEDCEQPKDAVTPFGAPAQPFALAIGRISGLDRYKGFDEMIEIWPAFQRERPGLALVIIGDGDDLLRLKAKAQATACDVLFLGAVDDATRNWYLNNCLCFCLPSRGEGFGLVYLEAMRHAKPILAGATDAGMEIIGDGVAGRAVNAADSTALLSGLCEVTGPRIAAFGAAGRQRFYERFTYEQFCLRFAAEVSQLVR